jgi:hypothetical protein
MFSNYKDFFEDPTAKIKYYQISDSNFKIIRSTVENAVRQGYLKDSLNNVKLSLDYDLGVFLYISYLKNYCKQSVLYTEVEAPPKKQMTYSQFKFLHDKLIFI